MENCLVKKLQTTVDDENLLGFGELRITFDNTINYPYQVQIKGNNSFYFDIDIQDNITCVDETEKVYKILGPCKIILHNYYYLQYFSVKIPKFLSIGNLNAIQSARFIDVKTDGENVSKFKSNTINTLYFYQNDKNYPKVIDNLVEFINNNIPNITWGSFLSYCKDQEVNDLIDLVINKNKTFYLFFDDASLNKPKLYIDTEKIIGNENRLSIDNSGRSKIYYYRGDISNLNFFVSQQYFRNTDLTWGHRDIDKYVLGYENIYLPNGSEIDKALINLAQCKKLETFQYDYQRFIKLKSLDGTRRSSASNTAVQILTDAGYLVSD